jgi:hypothetical protein
MTRVLRHAPATLLATLLLAAGPAGAQPAVGQVDTFEDGTTQGWTVGADLEEGSPFAPAIVPGDGPGGANDNYLRLRSRGGTGPGSRLTAFNVSQWTGDYLAAGITGVSMDVRNFGPSDLTLRLLLLGPFGPTGPEHIAVTTTGVALPAGGQWTSVFFPLTLPGSLNMLRGTAAGALSDLVELRLFHNPLPVFGGPGGNSSPAVQTTVGVDNIRAMGASTVVPEPSTVALLGTGILALAAGARARRRPTN